MTLDNDTLDYLYGKKFSNSLQVPYSFFGPIPDRVSFLRNLAEKKRIVHLGCLDHLPLIDSKVERKQWLHKELTDVASQCIGLDIDKEALQYVEKKYHVTNIRLSDFTKDRLDEIITQQWDYAILGELLEHIDNPVDYLTSIATNYSDCLKKIVITVPNAWTQTTMKKAAESIELINSDHRYWFTPFTLAKVIIRAGMKLEEIHFANRVPLSVVGNIKKRAYSLIGKKVSYNFTYASSIVAIASLK
jgi:hypothetical protein